MKKFAVIGYPLSHTLSPAMHEYLLDAMHIKATYVALSIDGGELGAIAQKLRDGDLTGINVTLPYKTAIIDFLDTLDDVARLAGAVNCAMLRDGQLIGTNTDVAGIKWAFASSQYEVAGKHTMVLGAGGAARAAILAISQLGAASIALAGRKPDALKKLTDEFADLDGMPPLTQQMVDENMSLSGYEMIVNATPIGMWPALDNSPIDTARLTAGQGVFDMIYRPEPTKLMEAAAEVGCHTVSGLDMFIGQGLASFKFWFPELEIDSAGLPVGIEVDDLRRHLRDSM